MVAGVRLMVSVCQIPPVLGFITPRTSVYFPCLNCSYGKSSYGANQYGTTSDKDLSYTQAYVYLST